MALITPSRMTTSLPPVTIIIEWENAIDVEGEWTGESGRRP